MTKCYQCGGAPAEVGLLCRSCVEKNKSNRGSSHESYQAASVVAARSSLPSVFGDARMIGIALCIVIALFLLARANGIFGYGTLAPLRLESTHAFASDPCAGKRRCLIVLLAPWCPACKASVPFVRSVSEYVRTNADLGMQVVVALDERPNLLKLGAAIGGNVYIDPQEEMYRALGAGGVPRWAVIERERKIIQRGSGLPAGLGPNNPAFDEYLKNRMGFY